MYPVGEGRRIALSWPIWVKNQAQRDELLINKPEQIVSHLIGHEGKLLFFIFYLCSFVYFRIFYLVLHTVYQFFFVFMYFVLLLPLIYFNSYSF